jgi:hypothetical protein
MPTAQLQAQAQQWALKQDAAQQLFTLTQAQGQQIAAMKTAALQAEI